MAKKYLSPLNLLNLTSDPGTAAEGDFYWNSSTNRLRIYFDSAWADVSSNTAFTNAANTFTTDQTITPATSLTGLTINAAASSKGLIVKANATTPGNLQEWQNSAGTVLSYFANNGQLFLTQHTSITQGKGITWNNGDNYITGLSGYHIQFTTYDGTSAHNEAMRIMGGSIASGGARVGIGSTAPGSKLQVNTAAVGEIGLIVRGIASQTAALQEWQNSSGTVVASLAVDGAIRGNYLTNNANTNPYLDISGSSIVILNRNTVGNTVFAIRGMASQSGNLQVWQNSSLTNLRSINSAGSEYVHSSVVSPFNMYTEVSNNNTLVAVPNDIFADKLRFRIGTYEASVDGTTSWTAGTFQRELVDGRNDTVVSLTTANKGHRWTWNAGDISWSEFKYVRLTTTYSSPSTTYDLLVESSANGSTWTNQGSWTGQSAYISKRIFAIGYTGGDPYLRITLTNNAMSAGIPLANIEALSIRPGDQGGAVSGIEENLPLWWNGDRSVRLQPIVATGIPLVARGFTSQSANLTEWQNSAASVLASVDANGQGSFKSTTLTASSSSGSALTLVAAGGQTADLFTTAGGAKIPAAGNYFIAPGIYATYLLKVDSGIATQVAAVIKGFASQSADLTQWQNSSASVLAKIDASGNLTAASIVKTSGTSAQFLKADGTVDSSTYLTTGTASSTYQPLDADLTAIAALASGTGLLKNTAGTWSLDTSSYLTTGTAASTYLPLTGGTISSDLTITGSLTVNGTTTNLNSTNLVIEDKNIIIADVATPSNTTADGAGITIKGATDKTFTWVNATGYLTSNVGMEATSFVKTSGTSAQFLKADGSVDSATYITAAQTFNLGTTSIALNRASAAQSLTGITSIDGSAATLTTSRNIGDVAFNGSANIVPTRMYFKDTRSTNHNPYAYGGVTLHLKTNTTDSLSDGGTYHGVLNLTHWDDSSGGVDHQIGLTDNGNMHIRYSTGASSWSSWNKFVLADSTNTFTGQIISTRANSTTTGDGQIYLNGATGNRIDFNTNGASAPAFTTRSVGTKIVLFPEIGASAVDYAIGIENSNVWFSTPLSTSARGFKWYGGTTERMSLRGDGTLSLNSTSLTLGNGSVTHQLGIVSGAAANVGLVIRGAASQSGNLLELQDSSGNNVMLVKPNSSINARYFDGIAASGTYLDNLLVSNSLTMVGRSTTAVTAIVRGAASQTADLQQWQNSAGGNITRIDTYGRLGITTSSLQNSTGGFSQVSIVNANTTDVQLLVKAFASQTANLQEWQSAGSTTAVATLSPSGAFTAITKSFDIPHPTKENMRLRYGSLEGPENGVYVRGRSKEDYICLPDYWAGLVDEDTITVNITPIGKKQDIYVDSIEDNKVYLGGKIKEYFFTVYGERKDVDKLLVEY